MREEIAKLLRNGQLNDAHTLVYCSIFFFFYLSILNQPRTQDIEIQWIFWNAVLDMVMDGYYLFMQAEYLFDQENLRLVLQLIEHFSHHLAIHLFYIEPQRYILNIYMVPLAYHFIGFLQ